MSIFMINISIQVHRTFVSVLKIIIFTKYPPHKSLVEVIINQINYNQNVVIKQNISHFGCTVYSVHVYNNNQACVGRSCGRRRVWSWW